MEFYLGRVFVHYLHLIKLVNSVFRKIAILCFGTHLKDSCLVGWNRPVEIRRIQTDVR
jgi:hypothetical protein